MYQILVDRTYASVLCFEFMPWYLTDLVGSLCAVKSTNTVVFKLIFYFAALTSNENYLRWQLMVLTLFEYVSMCDCRF
jgi:hypothetical protein